MEALSPKEIRRAVRAALDEDLGSGDVTTLAIVPKNASAVGLMIAREPLIAAGLAFAEMTFREFSSSVQIEDRAKEGTRIEAGAPIMRIVGPARAILSGERVALNFVQRISGIATMTAQFVQAVQGTSAKILDTRKTTPGWRRIEKYAVACGGGTNHRMGLFDMVLIKDNHLVALQGHSPNPIAAAIRRARRKYPRLKIEVEADTLQQARQAVEAGADFILLDNFSVEPLRAAVRWIKGRAQTEASGGVTVSSVRAIAETGVDFISVGALTHSARAVDIALDFVAQENQRLKPNLRGIPSPSSSSSVQRPSLRKRASK